MSKTPSTKPAEPTYLTRLLTSYPQMPDENIVNLAQRVDLQTGEPLAQPAARLTLAALQPLIDAAREAAGLRRIAYFRDMGHFSEAELAELAQPMPDREQPETRA